MLTIDLDKLNIVDGSKILDLGCGKGRHIHKLYYYSKCHVIGLDLSLEELKYTYQGFQQYPDINESSDRKFSLMAGTALQLPFKDNTFDHIICSEVLEHIYDYDNVINEIFRISKPGASIGVSVPRWLPEKICWLLSDDYHNEPGGHIRIFKYSELKKSFLENGFNYKGKEHKHGLHSPYWWLKCFVGVKREDNTFVNFYKSFLEWDIMKRPLLTRILEKLFDPLMGKSIVLYFKKNN
jgi:SAM-dependent methyltransferase